MYRERGSRRLAKNVGLKARKRQPVKLVKTWITF